MSELHRHLKSINDQNFSEKSKVVQDIRQSLKSGGYEIVESVDSKPWGAYFRINSDLAGKFIEEFFPGLSLEEAQLGIENAELSPKILLVQQEQRLSWQYHDRRAERWIFLTGGGYHKSKNNEQGELISAQPGDWVQFEKGERHRLVGSTGIWTVVAEIWQHTDSVNPSNEEDIVRVADDYQR